MCFTIVSNSGRRFLPSSSLSSRSPSLRIGVDDGEIELILGRIEIDEQVVDLVEYFRNTGVGPVDLVDDDDRRQLGLQRLHQHVARLRERTLAGVHQQHDAVYDLQSALDLAAEVAVAGSVDDIDFDAVA